MIDNHAKDKEEADHEKKIYMQKYKENERDKDNLLQKNSLINDLLLKNQAMINQLKGDNHDIDKQKEK